MTSATPVKFSSYSSSNFWEVMRCVKTGQIMPKHLENNLHKIVSNPFTNVLEAEKPSTETKKLLERDIRREKQHCWSVGLIHYRGTWRSS